MSKFLIQGRFKLQGEIKVNGAKNAALKIIPASLLSEEELKIDNVPLIEDVERAIEILKDLGSLIKRQGHKLVIQNKDIKKTKLSREISPRLRASILFIGPLLARFGEAYLPFPGGCPIGQRPIDIFINGFKALGAKVEEDRNSGYFFKAKKLKGGEFFFPTISVTATEALMMAAVLAQGTTVLKNAASEPEIPALADYLNKQGAEIQGAGTHIITIKGVKSIGASNFEIMPDRIEAGTFAILGAATRSSLKITQCLPEHLDSLWAVFKKMNVPYELGSDYIFVHPASKLKAANIFTREYPGFPTDLQAPMTVFLTQASGLSLVHETIFESRLFYIDKLNKMGAKIILCDPHRAVVSGPSRLYGHKLESPDIRAGMAMIIAAMVAEGTTEIDNIYQIDRGYERIDQRLNKIGAKIERR